MTSNPLAPNPPSAGRWLLPAGVLPAALLHGSSGAWDELALVLVAFILFTGYVVWLRLSAGTQKRNDQSPETLDKPVEPEPDLPTDPDNRRRSRS